MLERLVATERRLDRLEKETKFWRVVCLIGIIGTILHSTWALATDAIPAEIRAKRFVVVNAENKRLAAFEADAAGGMLTVNHRSGNTATLLAARQLAFFRDVPDARASAVFALRVATPFISMKSDEGDAEVELDLSGLQLSGGNKPIRKVP